MSGFGSFLGRIAMTLSDLASIASVISGIAVLGSLIYLAQQTRQNAKHTRALIHQGRAELTGGYFGGIASDPSLTDIIMRGLAGDQTLDDVQAARYVYSYRRTLLSWEDSYLQHREGLVDANRHAGTVTRVRKLFQSPGYRAIWKMERENYETGFRAFMDDLMNEVRPTASSNLGATWKSFVAAEFPSTPAQAA
jgi:hypothetical protein